MEIKLILNWQMLDFLKFFLENYQSSLFMDAIIWPVLIENIGIYIYLVSMTYPWPRTVRLSVSLWSLDCVYFTAFRWLSDPFKRLKMAFRYFLGSVGRECLYRKKGTFIRPECLSLLYYRNWKANITMQNR